MKLNFYSKLFLTFILFASILLTFSLYTFKKFYEEDIKNRNINTIFKSLDIHQETFNNKQKKLENVLIKIGKSQALNNYENEKDDTLIKQLLEHYKVSQKIIHSFTLIDLKGNEKLKYIFDKNSLIKEASSLYNIKREELFRNIITKKESSFYHSNIYLKKQNNELYFPLVPLQNIVLRTKNYFLMLEFEIMEVFDEQQKKSFTYSYIVDEKGDFLVHENSKYNWSSYFTPNYTLEKLFDNQAQNILSKNDLIFDKYLSKRFYISNDKYLIFIVKLKKLFPQENSKRFEEHFESILYIGLLIAIVLTILLSEPISKLNRKIIEENKDLDLSVKKSYLELSDSLKTIDNHIMSIRLDKNGIISDVSNAFCEVSGFSKGELIGHPHRILVDQELDDKKYQEVLDYIKKGNSYNFELKCLKKDGTYFWSESFIEPNFDIKNKLIGFTIIRNNITDKKTIQKLYDDLNTQVNQYNTIFENVNSAIALVDLNGKFKKVNRSVSDLFLYDHHEILSMNFFDFIHKDSKVFLEKLFDETLQIGSIKNIEKIFINKNGEEIHLELSLSLLYDRRHIILVMNSLEDKRKLQELNQNLEDRISEEVEKSRQKDKIHQEEQIKNAKLSSIGALAAGITHEINTPLTYIKGNFEMMGYDIEDLPSSEIKNRMLEDSIKINDGIDRIANIVESMREISQSSNEKKESVNIYSTLITALTMAYNRSKQICPILLNDEEFSLGSIDKNKYVFNCNVQKQRMEQVWIIILNNALDELVKIQNYENRLLRIKVFEEKDCVVIQFIDNAGGINNDIIDKIFQPFISSKEHSGMGVGLNIAKKIVEQQKGEIVAFNEHSGAVFEVKLKKDKD